MEPWLRGTLLELSPIERALLHSLEMAQEDTGSFCGSLTDAESQARPFQLPSVAFQLRHIARSLDRFCTYAEGKPLSEQQLSALAAEHDYSPFSPFYELEESIQTTRGRLPGILTRPLDTPIAIGRKRLATTVGGLLVHAAEHTQRHVGQAITTAKVIVALRAN